MKHESDVAKILSSNADRSSVKYAWPILKNMLGLCQGVISGAAIEIEPYIPPLNAFGTYWDAGHRIFMSATVTDDAFLVKGLQLKPDTIINPLTYVNERWSGEKMVLLPSLIHDDMDRERIVKAFGTRTRNGSMEWSHWFPASRGRRTGNLTVLSWRSAKLSPPSSTCFEISSSPKQLCWSTGTTVLIYRTTRAAF